MGLAEFAVGAVGTLASSFLSGKSWTLINLDTDETIVGQFPAEGPTREVASVWAQINSLNRQNPILQFIRGEADTFSVPTRFYKRDVTDNTPVERLEKIINWARIDSKFRRPPILELVIGAGLNESGPLGGLNADINEFTGASSGVQATVVLNSISGIRYNNPNKLGGVTEVEFQMNFTRYKPFNIDDKVQTDTRYARVRSGDTYETLAAEEYGDPMIGVTIRNIQDNKQPVLKTGSIVKLPAIEGVRGIKIEPKSAVFKTAFGRKLTPQKELRQQMFALRSSSRASFLFTAPKLRY